MVKEDYSKKSKLDFIERGLHRRKYIYWKK